MTFVKQSNGRESKSNRRCNHRLCSNRRLADQLLRQLVDKFSPIGLRKWSAVIFICCKSDSFNWKCVITASANTWLSGTSNTAELNFSETACPLWYLRGLWSGIRNHEQMWSSRSLNSVNNQTLPQICFCSCLSYLKLSTPFIMNEVVVVVNKRYHVGFIRERESSVPSQG